MDALSLHSDILAGYRDYIRSFIDIADDEIRPKVISKLDKGELWPMPRIQFNPAFERSSDILQTQPDHEPAAQGIEELPRLNEGVLAACGWHQPGPEGLPIAFDHGFYEQDFLPESDRTRHTLQPTARRELLTRLLKLNHHRTTEEAKTQNPKARPPRNPSAPKRG